VRSAALVLPASLQWSALSVGFKLHNPIAFRVANWIGKHGGFRFSDPCAQQLWHQVVSVEEIVPEHQRGMRVVQKVLAD
jgi:hypothetical protein